LKKVWPGKTIVILKANPSTRLRARKKPSPGQRSWAGFPKGIVCRWGKIGLRIPKYKLLNELLKQFNNPIAQTSANISSKPVPATIKEILEQFKDKRYQPDIVVDAGKLSGKSSVVIDLTISPPKVLRP